MKMPPSNSENYVGNGEDAVARLLKQLTKLWIDEGEDAGFEGTCKHLGLKVMQKSIDSDDEEESEDSDTEEVFNAGRYVDLESDDEDDETECSTKCLTPRTSAVQIILDGYSCSQEEIVKALKAQCDKFRDPADKLKFLTRREDLDQGYSVAPITYTAFTNKSIILKFLLDELRLNCGISLRHLSEHLDQRDRDGNNLLLAMASSQLDLSDSFKVLFNFHHYLYEGKKYFLVNHGIKNHRDETIFMILKRNGDITSELRERIRKTLQELIERPDFEREWIGNVLPSVDQQLPVEEDSQSNQDRFVQIVQDVSDPHANITIRQDSLPNADLNPEQRLEEESDPEPAVNLDEENNPIEDGVEDIQVPDPDPQANPGPGPENAPVDNPAPGVNLTWACATDACLTIHQTKEDAQQCAQAHGGDDVLAIDEDSYFDGDFNPLNQI